MIVYLLFSSQTSQTTKIRRLSLVKHMRNTRDYEISMIVFKLLFLIAKLFIQWKKTQ